MESSIITWHFASNPTLLPENTTSWDSTWCVGSCINASCLYCLWLGVIVFASPASRYFSPHDGEAISFADTCSFPLFSPGHSLLEGAFFWLYASFPFVCLAGAAPEAHGLKPPSETSRPLLEMASMSGFCTSLSDPSLIYRHHPSR